LTASFALVSLPTPAGPLPAVLRGPQDGPRLLILQPLFEELNRTRRLLALLGQALAARRIGSLLPDLPGTGDAPGTADWPAWQSAAAALAAGATHALGVRGGALLLPRALPCAALAPLDGAKQLRDLVRTRIAADIEQERRTTAAQLRAAPAFESGGYVIDVALASALESATPPPARHLDSPLAPWLQAEPHIDPDAVAPLADAIAAWMRA
jgi:hypothetical protein